MAEGLWKIDTIFHTANLAAEAFRVDAAFYHWLPMELRHGLNAYQRRKLRRFVWMSLVDDPCWGDVRRIRERLTEEGMPDILLQMDTIFNRDPSEIPELQAAVNLFRETYQSEYQMFTARFGVKSFIICALHKWHIMMVRKAGKSVLPVDDRTWPFWWKPGLSLSNREDERGIPGQDNKQLFEEIPDGITS